MYMTTLSSSIVAPTGRPSARPELGISVAIAITKSTPDMGGRGLLHISWLHVLGNSRHWKRKEGRPRSSNQPTAPFCKRNRIVRRYILRLRWRNEWHCTSFTIEQMVVCSRNLIRRPRHRYGNVTPVRRGDHRCKLHPLLPALSMSTPPGG